MIRNQVESDVRPTSNLYFVFHFKAFNLLGKKQMAYFLHYHAFYCIGLDQKAIRG